MVADPDHISNNPEEVVPPQVGYDETGRIRLPTWEYGQAETYTRAPWERCQLDIEVDLLDHMLLTFPWAHPSMAHGLQRMAEEGRLSTSQPMRLDYQEIEDAFGRIELVDRQPVFVPAHLREVQILAGLKRK